jgi:hypothetical protein
MSETRVAAEQAGDDAPDMVEDVSCMAFNKIGGLPPDSLSRFLVGEDTTPQPLTGPEGEAQLGDPVARLLFLRGIFPHTGEELLDTLAAEAPPGDPVAATPSSFVLGEGSQLGPDEAPSFGVRFVVATGGPQGRGPDVIVSTPSPTEPFVEVMAWDRVHRGFNFYRTVGRAAGTWVFAGNSRHALSDPTQGNGPFESHPSGSLLMKELEIPWTHWHSFEIGIDETVFPDGSPLATHRWFALDGAAGGLRHGAEVLEVQFAIPSMRRWAEARFEALAEGGTVEDPRRVMVQILGTPTVNLISTRMRSVARQADEVARALPPSFFFSVEALTNPPIGLTPVSPLLLPLDHYRASLETFAFTVTDGNGIDHPGDTTFAFFVPHRAREDDEALRAAIAVGLITPRLAASLLMVDFPNPIFSARREALLAHVPATATITDGASTFSQEMADAILAAAPDTPPGSPEREFAERWGVGEDFVAPFDALLQDYLAAVAQRLGTSQGFDDYVRLAESRRNRVRDMPIFETQLLFATTNIDDGERAMQTDGSVIEI